MSRGDALYQSYKNYLIGASKHIIIIFNLTQGPPVYFIEKKFDMLYKLDLAFGFTSWSSRATASLAREFSTMRFLHCP